MKKELLLRKGRLVAVETVETVETAATGDTPGDSSSEKPPVPPSEKPPVPPPDAVYTVTSPPPVSSGLSPLAPLLPAAVHESFTHLSEKQFEWLSWRLGLDSDEDACEMAGVLSGVVEGWREDPLFEAAYQRAMENKREAFRVLGTHLLPKALRVINKLLEDKSIKANTAGLQYLLKTQALLDQPQKDSSEQVARLLEALRTPGQVVPAIVAPRE